MAQRYPKKGVHYVHVYRSHMGFSYRCHDSVGTVVYQCPRDFRSRFKARDEIRRRWPGVRIDFHV